VRSIPAAADGDTAEALSARRRASSRLNGELLCRGTTSCGDGSSRSSRLTRHRFVGARLDSQSERLHQIAAECDYGPGRTPAGTTEFRVEAVTASIPCLRNATPAFLSLNGVLDLRAAPVRVSSTGYRAALSGHAFLPSPSATGTEYGLVAARSWQLFKAPCREVTYGRVAPRGRVRHASLGHETLRGVPLDARRALA